VSGKKSQFLWVDDQYDWEKGGDQRKIRTWIERKQALTARLQDGGAFLPAAVINIGRDERGNYSETA